MQGGGFLTLSAVVRSEALKATVMWVHVGDKASAGQTFLRFKQWQLHPWRQAHSVGNTPIAEEKLDARQRATPTYTYMLGRCVLVTSYLHSVGEYMIMTGGE